MFVNGGVRTIKRIPFLYLESGCNTINAKFISVVEGLSKEVSVFTRIQWSTGLENEHYLQMCSTGYKNTVKIPRYECDIGLDCRAA
jgi:hypothetical protein